MKSPLSPWLPYLAMIALCCACALYVGFGSSARMHIGPLYFPSKGNAVVRSLRGDKPLMATVAIDGGPVTDAEVAAGCLVQIGDRVFVRELSDGSEPNGLLVFPVNMGATP